MFETYPYKAENGNTRWACCSSIIGPTCEHVAIPDPAPLSYLEKAILAEIECIRGNDAAIKVKESIAIDEWRRGNDAESRRQREECANARVAISECFTRIHDLIEASNPPF